MHRALVRHLARCCPVWDDRGRRIPELGVPFANSTAAELIWTVLEAQRVLGFSQGTSQHVQTGRGGSRKRLTL